MSRELPPPSRSLRARAVQPLREALDGLGVIVEGRREGELIILASRELRAVKWARDERARRTEQQAEAHRLRHLALPSSVREPWALGAAVDIYELSQDAPYHHLRGQGVIAERRLEGAEVVSLRVSIRERSGEVLTRRRGSPYAWGNTDSATFVALAGTPLTPLSPKRASKLRIFTWTAEEYRRQADGTPDTRGSRVSMRYVIACGALRDLNVILKRTGNEWPHVSESSAPEREARVLESPLTLFKSAPFDAPTPPPGLAYAPVSGGGPGLGRAAPVVRRLRPRAGLAQGRPSPAPVRHPGVSMPPVPDPSLSFPAEQVAAPARARGRQQKTRPLWTGLHQSDRIGKVPREYKAEPQERKSLNQWRKARGLSIADLARRSGLGERALEHHLYDARNVGVRVALKLADALEILVEDVDWEALGTENLPAIPAGEPGTISDAQWEVAQVWLAAGVSKKDVAEALHVSRPTLYKRLKGA